MTDFDDRFADRVREVFDGYQEPVDPAAWDRLRAELEPRRAPDHAPLAGAVGVRRRWLAVALVATVALVVGVWRLADRVALPDGASRPTVALAPEPTPVDVDDVDLDANAERATEPEARSEPTPDVLASALSPAPAASPERPPVPRPQVPAVPAPKSRTPSPTPDVDFVAPAPVAQTPPLDTQKLQPISATDAGDRSVFAVGPPPDDLLPQLLAVRVETAPRLALAVVAGATSVFSDRQLAEGGGVSAGLSGTLPVGGRAAVSGGAQLAYTQFVTDEDPAFSLTSLSDDPSDRVDVPSRTEVTTLALEIPLDVSLDVLRGRRARLGVSVGLTSAVYLAQTFRDEGLRYSGQLVPDPTTAGGTLFVVNEEPYRASTTAGAASRVDLARQLTLAVRLTPAPRAASVEVFGRLPLSGLTSRDLPLSSLGVRVRVPVR